MGADPTSASLYVGFQGLLILVSAANYAVADPEYRHHRRPHRGDPVAWR